MSKITKNNRLLKNTIIPYNINRYMQLIYVVKRYKEYEKEVARGNFENKEVLNAINKAVNDMPKDEGYLIFKYILSNEDKSMIFIDPKSAKIKTELFIYFLSIHLGEI